jgi:hypothetical protein
VEGWTTNNYLRPARTARVDTPMVPSPPVNRGEPRHVIDLTEDEGV